jgi:ABC-2 type transport system ATP-binding protein
MPERFSLYPDLSVDENLNFYADIYSVPRPVREKRKQELLARTGMIKFKSRRAGALSGGMKQKLALSTLLVAAPDIIILDEPTTGVDPLSRIEFFDIIKDLKAEGKTIVISTPYLDEAEQGDTIVMLKNGQIIKQDTIDHLKSSFPAYLYRLEAQGDIFRQLEQINQSEHIITAYARGKSIRVLSRQANLEMDHTVIGSSKKETPKLEDIYLYYEQSHD